LHSDHTLGYPDLIFSPWVLGRKEALEAYGPHGLKNMTAHIEKAWTEDVRIRRRGLEQANATGYRVNVHEIGRGISRRERYGHRVSGEAWDMERSLRVYVSDARSEDCAFGRYRAYRRSGEGLRWVRCVAA